MSGTALGQAKGQLRRLKELLEVMEQDARSGNPKHKILRRDKPAIMRQRQIVKIQRAEVAELEAKGKRDEKPTEPPPTA